MDLLPRAPQPSPLSKYEMERMERIEANRKRMGERLGVLGRGRVWRGGGRAPLARRRQLEQSQGGTSAIGGTGPNALGKGHQPLRQAAYHSAPRPWDAKHAPHRPLTWPAPTLCLPNSSFYPPHPPTQRSLASWTQPAT